MQRIKLKIIFIVEPSSFKIPYSKFCSTR